jgi:hypothetical protein
MPNNRKTKATPYIMIVNIELGIRAVPFITKPIKKHNKLNTRSNTAVKPFSSINTYHNCFV